MARTVSAVFDSHDEATRAISALRDAGVSENSLSVVARNAGSATESTGGEGVVSDNDGEHTSFLRGIFGGGALGAGLGVAALAIPGVGPLAAVGAIAAAAVPGAIGIGAAAGAAAGSVNEAFKSHGVSDEDSSYYSDHMGNGGVFVSVDGNSGISPETAEDILYSSGGHSSTRSRGTGADGGTLGANDTLGRSDTPGGSDTLGGTGTTRVTPLA